MTVDIRVILLAVLLALAGCMPAKQAQNPASVGPGVDVTAQDAGEGADASADSGNATQEASAQDEDSEYVDVLQGREDLPADSVLSAEEKSILDAQMSFPVALDTDDNAEVQRYFHYYAHTHRGTMEGWLKRAQNYLPHIRARFLAEGLPEDLIYLPFAESGFNPFAVSSAGAGGIWQFMPQTGRIYGLTVDSWVDERRDPYMATEAAIAYLKKLYAEFGDWPLALAAYNAGEGAVGRALKKTGSEDYFSLCEASDDLKQETKLYVPKFLALVKVARNLEKLGFEPLDLDRRTATPSKLKAAPGTDLQAMARSIGVDWKSFRELNPALRKQEAPPTRTIQIAVPGHLVAQAQEFLKKPIIVKRTEYASHRVQPGDTWWGVAKKFNIPVKDLQKANTVRKLSVGQVLRVPGQSSGEEAPAVAETKMWASKRANYVVRQGDTVWSIAKQFEADPSTLLQANGLRGSTTLKVGQKLFVPDAGRAETKKAQAQADTVRKDLVSYQVRQGDTLWSIAKRFGVSAQDLLSWNKLAANTHIRPGDQLKVYSR
ncbi:LysM peptidoglycan-binding domain-containing protein [Desulfomicrobium salsuginis]